MKRTRVLIADDHILILEAFKRLLEPEFEVVGTVADGRALLVAAAKLKPDVIVLDISMPLLNGLDAGKQVKQSWPSIKLIFLTMDQDPEMAAEAFRLGASGYILKNSSANELPYAIREGIKGRSYVTPLVAEGMIGSFITAAKHPKEQPKPTTRQREVLQLLVEGKSMKEVAAILDITTHTVAFHKYTLMERLQLKTNAELIQFAIKQHLVPA
ncbi:MAG: response regulator transcription factor [Blastocatellia bacterium]|nr:response regulator transcription factor [Blastocatellia bacterium]